VAPTGCVGVGHQRENEVHDIEANEIEDNEIEANEVDESSESCRLGREPQWARPSNLHLGYREVPRGSRASRTLSTGTENSVYLRALCAGSCAVLLYSWRRPWGRLDICSPLGRHGGDALSGAGDS